MRSLALPFAEEDCLLTAARIGDRVAQGGVWHDGACAFHGAAIVPSVAGTVVYKSFDGALYDGSSGIALALARIAAVTGERLLAETALGALRHAVCMGGNGLGLYGGRSGIALAAALVTEAAASDEANTLAANATKELADAFDDTEPDTSFDLTSGLAGQIYALTQLAERAEEADLRDRLLAHALHLASILLSRAKDRAEGTSWLVDTSIVPTVDDLCGLAHGASGAALALERLSKYDPDFGRHAAASRRYERCWYDRTVSSWPDLRSEACGMYGPTFAHYWCQGSVGIGLERLGAPTASGWADATAAVAGLVAEVEQTLAMRPDASDFGLNLSICHGLGGAIDFLVTASNVTGEVVHLDLARSLARFGCDRSRALGHWPCGVLNGGETPGLMIGLAGIALVYLRAACPTLYGAASVPGYSPRVMIR